MKTVAENLLGRALVSGDGFELSEIAQVEHNLGLRFPNPLKQFWHLVGRLPMFMSSFEVFLQPSAVFIEDDYLIFQEENQSVCYWGIKSSEIENSDANVYQYINDDADSPEWYSENISLSAFLKMLMYYQCAQGGYQFGCVIYYSDFKSKDDYRQFLINTTASWLKVVEHRIESNGLAIYLKGTNLIWHFTDQNGDIDDTIYVSSLTLDGVKKLEKEYGFCEL
ncbi:hypothetical protein [Escherichia albertii]|uniref:hypothetical protein n=1 Tax=Escherichia albertii TaxID=208962 RepID=UPI00071ED382|nr:hypothetical protein [Escherichia albertii]EEW0785818.1 hypothetical protein [Escherichia albertii]EEW4356190.1 hypothetical protein [Escherichia albertii]EEW7549183.1 hypothetical protein [Escherichia albertii]EFB5189529.1 hypothetical protein [Escherichia albertii]MCU7276275.1 hypothetical protein [Escherichia albertii]